MRDLWDYGGWLASRLSQTGIRTGRQADRQPARQADRQAH